MMPRQGHPSMSRSNSGRLGGQGGGAPSQNQFPSSSSSTLVSQQELFNNNFSMLGDDVAFGDPYDGSSSVAANPNSYGQGQGHQQFYSPMLTGDQEQGQQQLDLRNFQHDQQQFDVLSNNSQQLQHAQQYQAMRHCAGPGSAEQQQTLANEQPLQQLHNFEPQRSDSSLVFPQQQQRRTHQYQATRHGAGPVKVGQQTTGGQSLQQQLPMFRQPSQAQSPHQQRLAQIQQQQPLISTPQQRPRLLLSQQFQRQNSPVRSSAKPVYEPGMCARRLTHYIYEQEHRPADNNIVFWRKFVADFFAPNAKKRLCVSTYGIGRHATGVCTQNTWHCEICNRKPCRGFESAVEALPRLFKIKYESGTLYELLYVDMPREYQTSSGQIVLHFAKASQESIFESLRVVRDGQLRVVFSPDLKICLWEFCARSHEELIPRPLFNAQANLVDTAAQKCQVPNHDTSTGSSTSEHQNNCNTFIASAHQLSKTIEVPLINDLGLSKRYVRCLQISEVVNTMKSLIDFCDNIGAGPVESLAKFPRGKNTPPAFQGQTQRPESHHQQQQQQQMMGQSSKHYDNTPPAYMQQLASTSANNSTYINSGPTAPSTNTSANFLRHSSMNSRLQNPPMSNPNPNTSYVNNVVQTVSPLENSAPSSFQSPRPSLFNNNNSLQTFSPVNMGSSSNIGDMDSQSSVQKIIQDMLMSSQFSNGGGMVSNGGNANAPIDVDDDILVGTGVATAAHPNMSVSGFDGIQNGLGESPMLNVNEIGTTLGDNYSMPMNGQAMDMGSQHDDQESWVDKWFE